MVVFSLNFNSRPSARGDCMLGGDTDVHKNISIHAPPRGATCCFVSTDFRVHFNSRPSARGDANLVKDCRTLQVISIHAPPRGATKSFLQSGESGTISIHAPPRGATSFGASSSKSEKFQFTPLREGRHSDRSSPRTAHYFNSRPSARGDEKMVTGYEHKVYISIHAPPRGATTKHSKIRLPRTHFNSRPSARGDYNDLQNPADNSAFQFTPLREGRQ